MSAEGCLFCKIIARELSADLVHEDERAVAFRDINPQAPVHILVVPRKHVVSLAELADGDKELAGHLLSVARKLASDEQLHKSGYRVVLNTGANAGQTVQHLHAHLLGGRAFRWPPG